MAADGTDDTNDTESGTAPRLSRRRAIQGAAWSVPVITVASAAPAFASSGATIARTTPSTTTFGAGILSAQQTLAVTVTQNASPKSGELVTFSVDGDPAWLSFQPNSGNPSQGTATSGVDGVASVQLVYGTPRPADGTTFTVLATYGAQQIPWTLTYSKGAFVVSRIGDGGSALSGTSAATFVDEYTAAGALVASVSMPTVAGSAPVTNAFSNSGSATSEGQLELSADGKYLTLGGYAAAPGTANVATSSTATVPRVVGRVAAGGGVNTTTTTTSFSGSNVRGASTNDGSAFYATGGATGIVYQPLGGIGAGTIVSTTITNSRSSVYFNGKMYFSTGSGTTNRGIWTVGNSTTAATTATQIIATGTTSSPYGFAFVERAAGQYSIYITDDTTTGTTNGILKFSSTDLVTWVARGNYQPTGVGFRDIAARVVGGSVEILAVTATATGGVVQTMTDTAAYDATISTTTNTPVLTAATNQTIRGIALTPSF